MEKIEQLKTYVQKYITAGIEQRSVEWHAARLKTVGGSEIGKLDDERKTFEMFNGKVKKTGAAEMDYVFTGCPATRWGTLMEPMIEEYFEVLHETEIHGANIFIYDHGNPVSYSPDGFAQMEDKKVALLEFKCPYGDRSIKSVPEYYKPQILYGLDKTSNVTDYGMFVQAKYRPARIKDIHETAGKHAWAKPVKNCKLLQYGIIGFIARAGRLQSVGDISELPFKEFEKEFDHIVQKSKPLYIIAEAGDSGMALMNELYGSIPEDFELVGYFGFKLVQCTENKIEREEGFIKKRFPVVKEFVDDVNKFISDPESRKKIMDKYRPCQYDDEYTDEDI